MRLLSEPTPPPVFGDIDLGGAGKVLCAGVALIAFMGLLIMLRRR